MREWKPGDVAVVEDESGEQRVAVRGDRMNPRMKHHWYYDESGIGRILSPARPLAVIDPEDREQVERLREAASRWADRVPYLDMREPGDLTHLDAFQAALREFADPREPRPEEPRGLGAVVEDAEGERYVLHNIECDDGRPWCNAVGAGRSWAQIHAVRVLSLGVTDEGGA